MRVMTALVLTMVLGVSAAYAGCSFPRTCAAPGVFQLIAQ